MKNRLQNFWYYYKVHTVIVLALLAALIYYLTLPKTAPADYGIAIVSPRGCSAEQLVQIQTILEQAGKDQNGDGAVTVNIRVFRFEIGGNDQDRVEIAGLDSDLVGKVSGLFFTEDPQRFEEASNGIGKASDAVPVSDIPALAGFDDIADLYLLRRADADQKYADLLKAIAR